MAPVEAVDSREIKDIKFLRGILLHCQPYTLLGSTISRVRIITKIRNCFFRLYEQLPVKSHIIKLHEEFFFTCCRKRTYKSALRGIFSCRETVTAVVSRWIFYTSLNLEFVNAFGVFQRFNNTWKSGKMKQWHIYIHVYIRIQSKQVSFAFNFITKWTSLRMGEMTGSSGDKRSRRKRN